MSLQYIQDKDITVCTLGAHQALIKDDKPEQCQT